MGCAAAEGYLAMRPRIVVQETRMGCDRFTYARRLHDRCALFWLSPLWLAQAGLCLPVACTPCRPRSGLVLRSKLEKGVMGSSLAMSHRLYQQVAFCEDAVRAHGALWLLPSIEEAEVRGAWGQDAVWDWREHLLQTKAAIVACELMARWPEGVEPGPMVRF